MKEQKPRKVVLGPNLAQFSLRKALRKKLESFDKIADYNRAAGRPAYSAIRLFRDDYADIAAVAREQSGGKMSIRDVHWKGLPVISERDDIPALELTA